MRFFLLTLALLPLRFAALSLQAAPVQFESDVLPFLEKKFNAVYLWQSGVTEAGANQLRSDLPHARINSK